MQNQIKLLEKSKHNHTNLYAYIKQAKTKTSIIGPIINMSGELCSSDQEMTNSFSDLLGDQLKPTYSPYSRTVDWGKVHKEGPEIGDCIDSLYVTPDMVKHHIVKSKRKAAAGPEVSRWRQLLLLLKSL